MNFEILPTLDIMKELYSQPLTGQRFKDYLRELQGGTRGELVLPIAGFNPMAKGHILKKIKELEVLNAEQVMEEVAQKLNATLNSTENRTIKIALNLADDLKGAWTNRHSTDFDSKFKINAFVERGFCTPYFWTSEEYTTDLIKERVQNYLNRTIFWMKNGRTKTLEDHLNQEVFVMKSSERKASQLSTQEIENIHTFYLNHKDTDDYSMIFNFFYRDDVSESLGYQSYGIGDVNGFEYAEYLNTQS